MRFTKMHGIGNDYVYINCFEENVPKDDRGALASRLADRHFGVGGDGLIFICPSDRADFCMDMYNLDGSAGGMCGNGIRCVGKYVYDRGLTDKAEFTVESGGEIKRLSLSVENGVVQSVTVDMGAPILRPADIPVQAEGADFIARPIEVLGKRYEATCVSMGNPHCVVFVDDVDGLDLPQIGPGFEHHPLFPERVNTEFVQILDRRTLKMRVWERGSGETLACGTGACASVVAGVLGGRCGRETTVRLLGGNLNISWPDTVYMQGPATMVFDGVLID